MVAAACDRVEQTPRFHRSVARLLSAAITRAPDVLGAIRRFDPEDWNATDVDQNTVDPPSR
jgi:hypothetical protein